MPRQTNVLSISLPTKLTKAIDTLSVQMDQTRSELVRQALREFLLDVQEDRERFLHAYKQTRGEKLITMQELKKELDLE